MEQVIIPPGKWVCQRCAALTSESIRPWRHSHIHGDFCSEKCVQMQQDELDSILEKAKARE